MIFAEANRRCPIDFPNLEFAKSNRRFVDKTLVHKPNK